MSDREPAILREPQEPGSASTTATEPMLGVPDPMPAIATEPMIGAATSSAREPAVPRRREAPSVYVVGFWRRLAAAAIDFVVIAPAALLITVLASRVTGVHLPPSNLRIIDIDLWIDLILAIDPALIMALALFCAIGLTYLLIFQIVVGRTLGMRVLNIKIIDVYGDRPSAARCIARCAGYLAGVATLFLGFLWMGFDSEKRGLQDWIAGTYVIRA